MFKKTNRKNYLFLSFLFVFCLFFYAVKITALEIPPAQSGGQSLGEISNVPALALYLFNTGMSLGFIAVFISFVLAGIMYFLSPISVEMRSGARDRVGGAVSGLLVLLLTYLILTTINPQLKIFTLNPPQASTPLPTIEKKMAGVYFYDTSGCPDNGAPVNVSSNGDLADLKNTILSVGIIHDKDDSFISILYDSINFRGKCQYLNPLTPCQSVTPFATSASIHSYNFSPNGDGVYIYRRSYFNESGGWLKITNSEIASGSGGGIYQESLDDLYFLGDDRKCNVPEQERVCVKYDEKGECSERRCPSLAGGNISSIRINGSYLVLLVYSGPYDDSNVAIWSSCQEFPLVDDVNKTGPQQIKWEKIKNNEGVIPNFILIIPVKF